MRMSASLTGADADVIDGQNGALHVGGRLREDELQARDGHQDLRGGDEHELRELREHGHAVRRALVHDALEHARAHEAESRDLHARCHAPQRGGEQQVARPVLVGAVVLQGRDDPAVEHRDEDDDEDRVQHAQRLGGRAQLPQAEVHLQALQRPDGPLRVKDELHAEESMRKGELWKPRNAVRQLTARTQQAVGPPSQMPAAAPT